MNHDLTRDGFVMVQRDPLSKLSEFPVVQNWFDELKRVLPAR